MIRTVKVGEILPRFTLLHTGKITAMRNKLKIQRIIFMLLPNIGNEHKNPSKKIPIRQIAIIIFTSLSSFVLISISFITKSKNLSDISSQSLKINKSNCSIPEERRMGTVTLIRATPHKVTEPDVLRPEWVLTK